MTILLAALACLVMLAALVALALCRAASTPCPTPTKEPPPCP